MRTTAVIFATFAALLLASSATADGAKLIYRIDSASAMIVKRHLILSAHGAVRTGGWDRPHLRVKEASAPEANTLEVDFVARPPAPDEVVVQALLPVSTSTITRLPHYGAKQVKFVAETNSLTVPITR